MQAPSILSGGMTSLSMARSGSSNDAADWSATMTIPHCINEDKSRGIKPGWYAVHDDGHFSSGPFASREECVRRIIQPTNGSIPYVQVVPTS